MNKRNGMVRGNCRGRFNLGRPLSTTLLGSITSVALAMGIVAVPDAAPAEDTETKTTFGRIEKVWIENAGITLDAKMDTGTLTSSLNARDIHIFFKDGEVWARFSIDNPDGAPITLARSVLRFARFKKQGHEVERRPVVIFGLCIRDVYRRTEVNLADREKFTYPVLIGRRFLSGYAVVDTEKKYTGPPRCEEMTGEH